MKRGALWAAVLGLIALLMLEALLVQYSDRSTFLLTLSSRVTWVVTTALTTILSPIGLLITLVVLVLGADKSFSLVNRFMSQILEVMRKERLKQAGPFVLDWAERTEEVVASVEKVDDSTGLSKGTAWAKFERVVDTTSERFRTTEDRHRIEKVLTTSRFLSLPMFAARSVADGKLERLDPSTLARLVDEFSDVNMPLSFWPRLLTYLVENSIVLGEVDLDSTGKHVLAIEYPKLPTDVSRYLADAESQHRKAYVSTIARKRAQQQPE